MRQHRHHQAEELLVRLMGGQQLFGDLSEIIQHHTQHIFGLQAELRLDQLAARQIHQLGILLLEVRHADLRQPLQPRAEGALRPARPPGHSTQFPQIAGQETDDQVRFPERVGAQDEGLAHPRRHRLNAISQVSMRGRGRGDRLRPPYLTMGAKNQMATLDWSQCPAVESVPGKVSGAWVFRGTRVPVSAIFENLKSSPIEEVLENFHVTRDQIQAVLDFAAKSAETPLESMQVR